MNNLFNSILSNTSETLTFSSALITICAAAVLGIIIATTYKLTQTEENYQKNFAVTLLMLPIILSVIILFVGSNIARAFSLAGTLSIIRFRSAPGDPKDIGFIFFDIAAGLACGVGLYGYGILFTLILCVLLIIENHIGIFETKAVQKQLRITVPENLNFDGAFEPVLDKYTKKYSLEKIKTTDLGSLFELWYNIYLDKKINEQEFINELRCRNGNLQIAICVPPRIIK